MGYRTALLGCSLREALGAGFEVVEERGLPADTSALQAALIDLCDRERVALVLTCGGTGLGSKDRVPQATAAILDYEVPGIGEAIRAAARGGLAAAMLCRSGGGVRGRTLIVNLPGGPKAPAEALAALLPTLPLALATLQESASS
jgi:molybdopterin adenylyltransferase